MCTIHTLSLKKRIQVKTYWKCMSWNYVCDLNLPAIGWTEWRIITSLFCMEFRISTEDVVLLALQIYEYEHMNMIPQILLLLPWNESILLHNKIINDLIDITFLLFFELFMHHFVYIFYFHTSNTWILLTHWFCFILCLCIFSNI